MRYARQLLTDHSVMNDPERFTALSPSVSQNNGVRNDVSSL